LVDGNIVSKIIAEVAPGPNTLVIEVGPGPGVLTEALLTSGATIVAIEKDDEFAQALRRLEPDETRLKILPADILECSLPDIITSCGAKSAVFVSNLPYHLTTPILQKILSKSCLFSKAVLMLQDEAARRLTGGKSNFLRCCMSCVADVSYRFYVPRGCFWPKPKVDSAVITLSFRQPLISDLSQEPFFNMLRMAFSHRRKTIIHSLIQDFPREKLIIAFDNIGLSHDSRPEEIPLKTWIELFHNLGFST
jgi:16S rRNA (adenine1518-N6/adenine1519-N6)-dimethyltransferase